MSANDSSLEGLAGGDSLACVACRARKLKCDRSKPACTRCLKLKAGCIYPESRRKPTFKRRNVKELEARLAQVEDLLRDAASGKVPVDALHALDDDNDGDVEASVEQVDLNLDYAQFPTTEDVFLQGLDYVHATSGSVPQDFPPNFGQPFSSQQSTGIDPGLGAMIGLGGLSEPLPPFEVMEELHRIFFTRQQHFIPILHPARYLQSFYSAPHMKPPMCLQYAVWSVASNGDAKYHKYHDVFYQRARQYLETDEMKGHGEHFITLAHAQAWCLVATDEARSMLFTRAAMSCARATQLSFMMGLHRLDCGPEDTSPTLAPPKDWAELEERRRTFWGVFCIDSHGSISTGWPHLIDVAESVTTRLPASESAFQSGEKVDSPVLSEALEGAPYSSFAGAIIICHLFNIVNRHVHRGKPTDDPQNYEYGGFWTRHRDIDNILSSAFMFLPECFRLPENNRDPTAIHTNLNLHATVICLHHGAIDQIEKHNLGDEARKISEDRLSCAAQEIVNIARLTSHVNHKMKSPLAALSLYSAASVYIYFAKKRREPVLVGNLDFLLSAMEAVAREHAITNGFLKQVVMDIHRNDIANIVRLSKVDALTKRFGSMQPNSIPMVARSHVSRHSECAPPLPGRLPLGNPVGQVSPRNMCEGDDGTIPVSHGFVPVAEDPSFGVPNQARPAMRAGPYNSGGNKRRRTSPSSTPDRLSDGASPFPNPAQPRNKNSADDTGSVNYYGPTTMHTNDYEFTSSQPQSSLLSGSRGFSSALAASQSGQTMPLLPNSTSHRANLPYVGTYTVNTSAQQQGMASLSRSTSVLSSRQMTPEAAALLNDMSDKSSNNNNARQNPSGPAQLSRGGVHGTMPDTPAGDTQRGWQANSNGPVFSQPTSAAYTTQDGDNGIPHHGSHDNSGGGGGSNASWSMSMARDMNPNLDWDAFAASLGVDDSDGKHDNYDGGGMGDSNPGGNFMVSGAMGLPPDIIGDIGHVP